MSKREEARMIPRVGPGNWLDDGVTLKKLNEKESCGPGYIFLILT